MTGNSIFKLVTLAIFLIHASGIVAVAVNRACFIYLPSVNIAAALAILCYWIQRVLHTGWIVIDSQIRVLVILELFAAVSGILWFIDRKPILYAANSVFFTAHLLASILAVLFAFTFKMRLF